MESETAIEAFQALGHGIRLKVFQLLLLKGQNGLPAGKIGEILNVAPSTLSPHLNLLRRARLLISSRDQQRIYYKADIEGTRQLLEFLTHDCCKDQPEICSPLLDLTKVCD